ncbi:hypothetical protein CRG98_012149 [Punica granatum]|uniref:Uncharacterized protein n=1 Tax=Punica granatum TaxID=22663 RepID=A0A2I0KGF0_PUNGR|nr:hypothetical protein CRG98_012149 [Punica granatum]
MAIFSGNAHPECHRARQRLSPTTLAFVIECARARHHCSSLVPSTRLQHFITRHQHPSPSTPALVIEHASACHRARQCPSPALITSAQYPSPAPVIEHACARHQCSSSAPVTDRASARHQHPAPVTIHACACHQRPSPAHRQCLSPALPAPVTSAPPVPVTSAASTYHQRRQHLSPAPRAPVTSARHSACQRQSSCPTLVTAPDRARARPPLHPNIFFQGLHRVTRLSNTSLTLSSYSEASMSEKGLDRRSEDHPDPKMASKLSANSLDDMAET